jgi:ribose/xylose/arabinose/galactoside ABC-type transport system permease subunit
MFVQTALLVAAAIAFAILFFDGYGSPQRHREPQRSQRLFLAFKELGALRGSLCLCGEQSLWISFAIPAIAIALYRVTRPSGYPDTIWFLGWAHAALFAAAAICLLDAPLIAATLLAPFLATLASGTIFLRRIQTHSATPQVAGWIAQTGTQGSPLFYMPTPCDEASKVISRLSGQPVRLAFGDQLPMESKAPTYLVTLRDCPARPIQGFAAGPVVFRKGYWVIYKNL